MSAKVDIATRSSRIADPADRVENTANRVENVGITCGRNADLSASSTSPRLLTLNESVSCGAISSEGRTAPTDTALVAHATPLETNGADSSMPVSKRTRYEVLKRDNHTCRYCGATAPDATLTVDHVVPTALGGSDKPENLVAACRDCNFGKASTNPGDPLVADVNQRAVEWGAAIATYNRVRLADRKKRNAYTRKFLNEWNGWRYGDEKTVPMPSDWEPSLWQFYASGMPIEEVLDAVTIACSNSRISPDMTFRYFCGVIYRKLDDMMDGARAIVEVGDSDGS